MQKDYFSNPRDALGATKLTFTEGKAKGMDVIIAHNNLFTMYILPDRGMDIYRLEYKGENIAYISPNGPVNPLHFGSSGIESYWSTFIGGFLLTCGLDNVMGPEKRGNKTIIQHGTYTLTPATDLKIETIENNGEPHLEISGKMEITALFGSRLVVKRLITIKYNNPCFTLKDVIVNEGLKDDEYMIMYHHNIGYPLFSENSNLNINKKETYMISKNSTIDQFNTFDKPSPYIDEMVYMHKINKGIKDHVSIENDKYKLLIGWNQEKLPYMVQWKCMQKNNYVLGLELCLT